MPLIPSYSGFAATPNLASAWLGGRKQQLAERELQQQAASDAARISLGYAQIQNQRAMAEMEFAARAEAQAKENLLKQQDLEIKKAYNEQMLGLREEDLKRKMQDSEAMMALREAGLGIRGQELQLKETAQGLREQEAGLREQQLAIQQSNLGLAEQRQALSEERFAAGEPAKIAAENRKALRDQIDDLRSYEQKAYGQYVTIADDVMNGNTKEYNKLGPFAKGSVDQIIRNRKLRDELEARLSAITESQTRAFVPQGMGTTTTNTLPRILRKTKR